MGREAGLAALIRATGLAAPGIVPRSNGRSGGSGTLLATAPEAEVWIGRAGVA